ncbi:hypothetical protein EHZ19_29160 [Paraburkholderia bannensis]|nr:hypothetical protein EHZ19_29160 [Paraburkholderia bannensis]RQN34083.1 hypothetical protein EHZ25_36305 [Paraburkholderia tropica]
MSPRVVRKAVCKVHRRKKARHVWRAESISEETWRRQSEVYRTTWCDATCKVVWTLNVAI